MQNNLAQNIAPETATRRGPDRRKTHRPLHLQALKGRRRGPRRQEEAVAQHHSDFHDSRIFWATLGVMLLCVFDAHYTLLILQHGGEELNVVMDTLIKSGPFAFISVKYLMTAASLFILVLYNRSQIRNRIPVRTIIYAALIMYSTLFAYELLIWPGELSELYSL